MSLPILMLAATAALASATPDDRYADKRAAMVVTIADDIARARPTTPLPGLARVLAIVGALPRERFVVPSGRAFAYVDMPQQIGFGQTISDPYIVTVMTAALDLPAGARVLDIGTGSGYQAAVLSPLAAAVSSIEIVAPLARQAKARLHHMGYRNIDVRSGDGFAGWPGHAPFDGIIVAAGASVIPQPLIDQLKPGGRMVIPIGPTTPQEQLLVVTKAADGTITRCSLGLAMFVPLTGRGQRPPDTHGLIDRTIPYCYGVAIT